MALRSSGTRFEPVCEFPEFLLGFLQIFSSLIHPFVPLRIFESRLLL